jgi:hypothetical protein
MVANPIPSNHWLVNSCHLQQDRSEHTDACWTPSQSHLLISINTFLSSLPWVKFLVGHWMSWLQGECHWCFEIPVVIPMARVGMNQLFELGLHRSLQLLNSKWVIRSNTKKNLSNSPFPSPVVCCPAASCLSDTWCSSWCLEETFKEIIKHQPV